MNVLVLSTCLSAAITAKYSLYQRPSHARTRAYHWVKPGGIAMPKTHSRPPPFKPNTPITTHEPRPPFLPRQGSSSLIRGTNRRRSSFYVCTADPPAVHRIEVGAPPVKQQPSITRLDRALPHVAAINDSGAPRASPSRARYPTRFPGYRRPFPT